MAKSKEIAVILDRLWSEFSDEENEIMFKCMSKAMKQCKKDIKEASPGGGEYRNGWAIRTKRYKYGCQGVVYNKTKPGLTHLLEKPHVIKNQYGKYERTRPDEGYGGKVHIAPAAERAEEYFVELLVKAHE